MAQVSKYPISKTIYERIFDLLLKSIVNLKTKSQVSTFFSDFLTPIERIMLAKRLAIGLLLAKGYKYREISKILRVSLATIGNVAAGYKYGKGYRLVVKNIIENEKMEDFWLKAGQLIASIGSVGGKGSGGWFYLRNELRKKRLNKPF